MKTSSYIFVTLISVVIIGIGIAFNPKPTQIPQATPTTKTNKTPNTATQANYTIINTWELPSELDEISGLSWIAPNTFACVQDEDGVLYIYNTTSKSITNSIEFAGSGDYEGLSIVNKDAYIMRSDGTLYEVLDYASPNKKIKVFETGFSSKHNMETLTYNPDTKQLVTAPKDVDLEDQEFKTLYTIDLETKQLTDSPLLKIDMNDEAFDDFSKKKARKTFNPSDVAIHPITKDIYVLEGKNPKLVIFNTKGVVKKVIPFNENQFPQPEGITFSPEGTLYISNEAYKGSATLLEVTIH